MSSGPDSRSSNAATSQSGDDIPSAAVPPAKDKVKDKKPEGVVFLLHCQKVPEGIASWKIPAASPEAVVVRAYFYFCGVFEWSQSHRSDALYRYRLNWTHTIDISPNGKLPVLQDGDTWIGGVDEIIQYFQNTYQLDADRNLSTYEKAIAKTLSRDVQASFDGYFNFVKWGELRNFYRFTVPLEGGNYRFPLRIALPLCQYADRRWHRAEEFRPEYQARHRTKVKNCFATLRSLLESNRTFFKSGPCSVDAYVIGYLAFARYMPCTDAWLSARVGKSGNQVLQYLTHYMEEIFQVPNTETAWQPPVYASYANVDEENAAISKYEKAKPFMIAAGVAGTAIAVHLAMSHSLFSKVITPSVLSVLHAVGIQLEYESEA